MIESPLSQSSEAGGVDADAGAFDARATAAMAERLGVASDEAIKFLDRLRASKKH